jgi:hypothetical protein
MSPWCFGCLRAFSWAKRVSSPTYPVHIKWALGPAARGCGCVPGARLRVLATRLKEIPDFETSRLSSRLRPHRQFIPRSPRHRRRQNIATTEVRPPSFLANFAFWLTARRITNCLSALFHFYRVHRRRIFRSVNNTTDFNPLVDPCALSLCLQLATHTLTSTRATARPRSHGCSRHVPLA